MYTYMWDCIQLISIPCSSFVVNYFLLYREQLRQFRLSLHDHFPSNASSTQDRLTEQRQWLKKFGQDISFGGSIRGPGSETGSVYPS